MKYTDWLRYGIIGGLFVSLLIPFIIANTNLSLPANWLFPVNTFFPFITGKNFVFRILTEIIFALWILLILRSPEYRPRFSWVLGGVVAFVAWAGFVLLFSADPTKSFWSNFERMEGYITMVHLLMYFLVASTVLTTERLWTMFLRASVFLSALMGLYGVMQLAGWVPIDQGGTRLTGTLGNAIYFAVYMLFNIFFAAWLVYRDRRNTGLQLTYVAILLLDLLMLLYSETRGTMLGLFGGTVVATAYFWWASRGEAGFARARQAALWGMIGLVVLSAVFIAVRNQPFMERIPGLGRLASISLASGETKTRIIIWGMAWQGFKERPVTGWGQENFSYVFNKYYEPELYGQEQWFDRAHNSYVDWAVNAGVPGFVFFIGLFITALWAVMRARDMPVVERSILIGLLVGFAVHEFFVFDNIVSWVLFFAVLSYAHTLSKPSGASRAWLARPISDNGVAVAAPIVGIAALVGIWYLNIPGIVSATTLINAIRPAPTQLGATGPLQNLAYYKDALAAGPLGRQEATEQLLTAGMTLSADQQASPEVKQAYYDEGVAAMSALMAERPRDARLELFLGNFYARFGRTDQALQAIQMARADSPRKQQILFTLGFDLYMRQGDIKKALEALKEAYDLDPRYDDALIYYAVALQANGQTAEGDRLLTERLGSVTPDSDTLLSAYLVARQYSRAAGILAGRLQKNPKDTQTWMSLASIYYTAGDRNKTIKVLKEEKAANPELAAQIDALIAQVENQK